MEKSLCAPWVDRIETLWDNGTLTDRLKTIPMVPVDIILTTFDGLRELSGAADNLGQAVYEITIGQLTGVDTSIPRDHLRKVAAQVKRSVQFLLEAAMVGLGVVVVLCYPRLCVHMHRQIHGEKEQLLPKPYVEIETASKVGLGVLFSLATWQTLSRVFSAPIKGATDAVDQLCDWNFGFNDDIAKCSPRKAVTQPAEKENQPCDWNFGFISDFAKCSVKKAFLPEEPKASAIPTEPLLENLTKNIEELSKTDSTQDPTLTISINQKLAGYAAYGLIAVLGILAVRYYLNGKKQSTNNARVQRVVGGHIKVSAVHSPEPSSP